MDRLQRLHMFSPAPSTQSLWRRQLRTGTVAFVMHRVDGQRGVEDLSCEARLSRRLPSE